MTPPARTVLHVYHLPHLGDAILSDTQHRTHIRLIEAKPSTLKDCHRFERRVDGVEPLEYGVGLPLSNLCHATCSLPAVWHPSADDGRCCSHARCCTRRYRGCSFA